MASAAHGKGAGFWRLAAHARNESGTPRTHKLCRSSACALFIVQCVSVAANIGCRAYCTQTRLGSFDLNAAQPSSSTCYRMKLTRVFIATSHNNTAVGMLEHSMQHVYAVYGPRYKPSFARRNVSTGSSNQKSRTKGAPPSGSTCCTQHCTSTACIYSSHRCCR